MNTFSLLSLLHKGGPIVWPILACSVLGLAIFMERLWYLFIARRREAGLLEEMEGELRAGRLGRFLKGFFSTSGPVSRMLTEAASVCCQDREAVEVVLDFHIDSEVNQAAKYTGLLSTLAAVSPLLGLLGTVTGLIKAFMVIEAAGGRVNAGMLAGGIWEAMLTTALGLGVAILLLFCHRFLMSRIRMFEGHLQYMAVLFIKGMCNSMAGHGQEEKGQQ